ncbi:unnamed protein product [Closterium sp. NIES-54]
MLLAPEGDLDAPDIPTPRSYTEAITGSYSSHRQTAMDVEMASWKSTGTYIDEVPPHEAPCERHDTLRMTLAALGFAPSTTDPSLFLRTGTLLPPLYFLVYVDDFVFATADTEALALVKSKLQKRHMSTDMGEMCRHLGLQITRDRARCTITLTQSHMVHQVLQRFGFRYSLPPSTALPTGHSLSAPPSDESVEPSGLYPKLVGCLMYLMTCTRPDLAYPLSILAHYVAPGRHRPDTGRPLRGCCATCAQDSPLPAPSPYSEQTDSLTKCHEPESCTALPARAVRIGRRVPRPRPPPDPGTHIMALRPSFVPLRVPLPSPPPSSLADDPDPEFDLARAASPTVPRLLATDPSFESTVASALVAELVDFATACRLDYATSLVAESESDCTPSVGVAVPHLVAMLLAPEGDLDAPDIPTPRSYAEAITGSYSSQRQTAMDVEMASWKSTGTYIDEVPPHEVNIVDGMWIFRVKRPPGSPPVLMG